MAHEINNSDRFGEVRVNGKRAWHGLGVEIADGLSAVEGFKAIGLDWKTELLPVYAERLTMDGIERIEAKEHKLHVRADNREVLGMVSDGYAKIDNLELAQFADGIMGDDMAGVLETAGSLYSGKRVFALIRLPQTIVAARGDELAQYLAISNGHGGTAAFAAYPTSVRIVCANTLRMSEREISRGARFMHTGDMQSKLKTSQMLLGFAAKEFKKLEEQVTAMARKMLTADQVKQFMHAAFEAAFPAPAGQDPDTMAKWLAKRDETFVDWRVLFENERNAMASIRGSLWAAFNTVTEWHDHGRGRFTTNSDGRVHSNLFGVSHVAKAKTMKLALSLV